MPTASIARPARPASSSTERAVIAAIKSQGPDRVKPGDVIVLICRGPMGAGMEEIYQITSALKHLSFGKHIAVLTDARFSGVSTGACIGHVGPEALAGGPIGKVRDGDPIRIIVDRNKLEGSVDLVGELARARPASQAAPSAPRKALRSWPAAQPRPDLAADPRLPADTSYGPPCNRSAAAPGAAASTTSTPSPGPCNLRRGQQSEMQEIPRLHAARRAQAFARL